jgi:hypothetical protein
MLKIFYHNILNLMPKNRFGDKFIAYVNFIRSHKRLPNKNLLNDYLFKIKTTDEILNILRQYTSDKDFVKKYIRDTVGDFLNVKTKAILSNADDVRRYQFMQGDVVKPTHASGLVYFVKDNDFDKSDLIDWLSLNYYNISREANYRYLNPKIIVEEPVFGRTDVDDIKFFCVNGQVKVIQWDFDRYTNHTRMLYDRNWYPLNASLYYPKSSKFMAKPSRLEEMIVVAEKLSKPFWLVRVDLYYDETTEMFLVGEITHCHGSSNEKFDSKESEILVSNILFH